MCTSIQLIFCYFVKLASSSLLTIIQYSAYIYQNLLQLFCNAKALLLSILFKYRSITTIHNLFDKSIMQNQKVQQLEISNSENKTKQIKKGRPYKRRQPKSFTTKKHQRKTQNNASLLLKKIYQDILGVKADFGNSGYQKYEGKETGSKYSIETTDAIHFKDDQMVGEKQKIIQIQEQNNQEFFINKNEVFLDISSAIIDYFSGQVCYTFTDKQREKLANQKNSRINWENQKDWNLEEQIIKQAFVLKTCSFDSSKSEKFVNFLLKQFAYYFDREATTDWYQLIIKIWKYIVKERKLLLKNSTESASIYIDSSTLADKILNDIKGPSSDEFPFLNMTFTKVRLSKKVPKKQHEVKLKTLIQQIVQVILNEAPFQKY